MAENRRKLNLGNRVIEVTDVGIVERKNEAVAEYHLEDGSIIRVATPITAVLRTDEYDWEGKPIYLAMPGTSVTVIHVPDGMIKKQ